MPLTETNFTSIVTTAMKAEGATNTGRINLVLCLLLAATIITLFVASGFEVLSNALLIAFDKETLPGFPDWLLPAMLAGFFVLLGTCLYVVSKMEQKKNQNTS